MSAQHVRFPNRETATGKMLNSYLAGATECNDRSTHLVFSANRWESVDSMLELINSGVTLIVDRYTYSGVAYTAAKGYDLKWCKAPDRGLPRPDLVIYIDIPSNVAASRSNFGTERYEKEDFQNQISDKFRKLRDENWVIINGCDSICNIQNIIMGHVMEKCRQSSRDPVVCNMWE